MSAATKLAGLDGARRTIERARDEGVVMILVTNLVAVSHHETPAKAARRAHRWLRRRMAAPGEWATILDPATGAITRRYVRRADGRVERAQ